MLEEPWGPFDPSSTARMCLRGYNWVKNRPRSLSGLILMISEASETQLKQIFGLVWHVTDNNNIVVWTGGPLNLSNPVCMSFMGYNRVKHWHKSHFRDKF